MAYVSGAPLYASHAGAALAYASLAGEEAWLAAPAGGGIDDIPGLIWATDVPIVSTASGALNPVVPLSINSGAAYVAFAFTAGRETGSTRRAIFALEQGDQWGNRFTGFSVFLEWGEARIADTGQVRADVVLSDTAGRQTWEAWWSLNNTGLVTENDGSNIQTGAPALAEIYGLRFGHLSDWGGVSARRDQTIYRMRIYDRVPNEEERAAIKAWVSG